MFKIAILSAVAATVACSTDYMGPRGIGAYGSYGGARRGYQP